MIKILSISALAITAIALSSCGNTYVYEEGPTYHTTTGSGSATKSNKSSPSSSRGGTASSNNWEAVKPPASYTR